MKRQVPIAWIAVAAALLSTSRLASAAQMLDVQVIGRSISNSAPSSVVTVTIRNIGNVPAYLPKPFTPTVTPDGHLQNNLFDVRDRTGQPAPFIGRYVKVIPDDPDTYYLKLLPGQFVTHDLDLAADYDLSRGGVFSAAYEQRFTTEVRQDARGEITSKEFVQKSEIATVRAGNQTRPSCCD
ncbi:hypothetical protein KPL74_10130 [Bacillus sp. NP157]|nr:hypothetical protein KPL74_10130 [Bacillus sp. NP157]